MHSVRSDVRPNSQNLNSKIKFVTDRSLLKVTAPSKGVYILCGHTHLKLHVYQCADLLGKYRENKYDCTE